MTRKARRKQIADHLSDALIVSLLLATAAYFGTAIVAGHSGSLFGSAKLQFAALLMTSLTFTLSFTLLQGLAHGSRMIGLRYARCGFAIVALSLVGFWIPVKAVLWVSLICGCALLGYVDVQATNKRVVQRHHR